MRAIADGLAGYGLDVVRVVCGIAVASEQGKDPRSVCEAFGAELDFVGLYGAQGEPEAVDEVCERDFFVFCPMTGRSFVNKDMDTGAPYIAPFGRPSDWASLDEFEWPISQRLIRLNADVLEMIEQHLGRPVIFNDLHRLPHGVRHPDVRSESVREHLLAHLD